MKHYSKHANSLIGLNQRAGDDKSLVIVAIKTARQGGYVVSDGYGYIVAMTKVCIIYVAGLTVRVRYDHGGAIALILTAHLRVKG